MAGWWSIPVRPGNRLSVSGAASGRGEVRGVQGAIARWRSRESRPALSKIEIRNRPIIPIADVKNLVKT
jgi:hypothetical protein